MPGESARLAGSIRTSRSGRALDLQVWKVDLRQPQAWIDDATGRLLGPCEQEQATRGTPDVCRRRLVASIALRIVLARRLGRPAGSLRFLRNRSGKPELAGNDRSLHFNLSRSGDCCLIAVTSIGPVGVDVERVTAIPDLEAVVRGRFAAEEVSAILPLSGERRLRAFYNCWTRKEAYLKARGVGLFGALDAVVVTVGDRQPSILSLDDGDPAAWGMFAAHPGHDLVGAVAVEGLGAGSGCSLETRVLPLHDRGVDPWSWTERAG